MKAACLIICFVVAACTASVIFNRSLDVHWELFKKTHGKTYESPQEELKRRMIWEKHLIYIEKHNEEAKIGKHSFFLNMNKFGDLTNAEFRATYNGFNQTKTMEKPPSRKIYQMPNSQIPDSVDWRKQGYVTPVKDQGQCGSCWAFSAIASLEGQHFKAAGQLTSLSEQNLVDCSRAFGNMGCDGGLMDQAFAYIEANKGVDTEKSYPYEAYDQKCKFNPNTVGATVTNFVDIRSGSEEDLTSAIANVGPIAVAIDASQDSFQFYSSGIYYEPMCSSKDLDHGVTAVGYGEEGNKHKEYFYIVKNSWGEGWGDAGYIKMARNNKNMCGIATQASYPEV